MRDDNKKVEEGTMQNKGLEVEVTETQEVVEVTDAVVVEEVKDENAADTSKFVKIKELLEEVLEKVTALIKAKKGEKAEEVVEAPAVVEEVVAEETQTSEEK